MVSVTIMGRLVEDPKEFKDGCVDFRIASDAGKKDGETTFLDVVCFDKTAEFVMKWFKKGKPALVVGELNQRSFKRKDGTNGEGFRVNAYNVSFVSDGTGGKDKGNGAHASKPDAAPAAAPNGPAASIDIDDLPF